MKLYHSAYTQSGRARWILEEIGEPYEIERIALREGKHRTPEYLAIHPHGSVPALVNGDLKLTESSAIALHLADKFPQAKLAPAIGTDDRAKYYRWIVFAPATVDPVLETLTRQTRFLPQEKRNPALVEEAKGKWGVIARVLEEAVDGRSYIVGNSFTAADVVVASVVGWVAFLGMLGDHPKLAAYAEPFRQRAAYQRAYAD